MKKIVALNTCDYGSTGKIMCQIADQARNHGMDCWTAVPEGRHNPRRDVKHYIWIGNRFAEDSHIILGWITGLQGYFSLFSTLKFLKELDRIKPDVIHLHNLHNSYINLPLLFRYIKKNKIKVIWTLHDCWAFTGHCAHFTMEKCEKWKTGCEHCVKYRTYPQSFVDHSRWMWKKKKKWFTGVEDLTIVTPSQWLADLVKKSFLREYPVKVIHNGIDLSVFRPVKNDFRKEHRIPDEKFLLLGVAFGWGKRKGLDVFIELSKRLDESRYQIVLVGTDESVDHQLPENIISIHRTRNQTELTELYSAADLLVNPTREDNYPTVNMEAIACGTPVLTFRTGGSVEIMDASTGSVVDCDDIDALEKEIIRINKERPYSTEACLCRAKSFDKDDRFREYISIYEQIVSK